MKSAASRARGPQLLFGVPSHRTVRARTPPPRARGPFLTKRPVRDPSDPSSWPAADRVVGMPHAEIAADQIHLAKDRRSWRLEHSSCGAHRDPGDRRFKTVYGFASAAVSKVFSYARAAMKRCPCSSNLDAFLRGYDAKGPDARADRRADLTTSDHISVTDQHGCSEQPPGAS